MIRKSKLKLSLEQPKGNTRKIKEVCIRVHIMVAANNMSLIKAGVTMKKTTIKSKKKNKKIFMLCL
jgi:hypothetical protein